MTDANQKSDTSGAKTTSVVVTHATGIPPADVHTVYADGIANIAPGDHVIRFYLFRTDPDISGAPSYQNRAVTQVIMPLDSFIVTAAFMNKSLDTLVEQGIISRERLELLLERISAKQK
jgi:hypothetical protein